jgi:hypothetical protein
MIAFEVHALLSELRGLALLSQLDRIALCKGVFGYCALSMSFMAACGLKQALNGNNCIHRNTSWLRRTGLYYVGLTNIKKQLSCYTVSV